jgi:collagenase-like PrtC family protease
MKTFAMPADFKAETVERYAALNRAYADCKVENTYGNISLANPFASGRNINKLPPVGMPELAAHISRSRSLGIDFHYTLNSSFLQNREFTPDGMKEIRAFLDQLYEAGVRTVIVAMPSLMELVRSAGGRFEFKASAICEITSANKALAFKKMGAGSMVVDETINRQFTTLRRIREAFGPEVQVIVNSICHQDCQYRMFHYNQISGDSACAFNEVSGAYYPLRCASRLYEDLANYFKTTWIRPEDLHYYTEVGITSFKMQGRQWVLHGDPIRAVECYFKESYEGDLKELLFMFAPSEQFRLSVQNGALDGFLRPFAERESFCSRDCTTCDYCDQWARKCFDTEAARQVAAGAVTALAAMDPFNKLVSLTSR